MYVVEKKKGRQQAKKISGALNISKETKKLMILDKNGKKIMKDIDPETFRAKFG